LALAGLPLQRVSRFIVFAFLLSRLVITVTSRIALIKQTAPFNLSSLSLVACQIKKVLCGGLLIIVTTTLMLTARMIFILPANTDFGGRIVCGSSLSDIARQTRN